MSEAMKLAIPIWNERVSPVFDSAKRLLVVDLADNNTVSQRYEETVPEADLAVRARYVANLGIAVLICGAISRPLETLLAASNVQVIPQVCGPVEDILAAFLAGKVTDQAFLMPGCCGRQRNHGRHGRRGRGGGCRAQI